MFTLQDWFTLCSMNSFVRLSYMFEGCLPFRGFKCTLGLIILFGTWVYFCYNEVVCNSWVSVKRGYSVLNLIHIFVHIWQILLVKFSHNKDTYVFMCYYIYFVHIIVSNKKQCKVYKNCIIESKKNVLWFLKLNLQNVHLILQ